MTRNHLVLALSLAGLILLNVVTNVTLIWLMEERVPGNQWFHQLAIGLLISQVVLTGLWLGLGDGRWLARLLVAVALSILAAKTIGWAAALSPTARRQGTDNPWAMISFMLIAMMLTTSLFASLLRRLRSWRLTWEEITSVPAARQFQIVDALLWMMPICGALAAIRFLTSLDDNFPHQLWDLALFTARTTAILLVVLVAAFASRWHVKGAILLILAILLVGAALSVPDIIRDFYRLGFGTQNAGPPGRFVQIAIYEVTEHEAFAVAVMLGGLTNLLALRSLGCKLIRPGTAEPIPPPPAASAKA
jgi:hypothetical protein